MYSVILEQLVTINSSSDELSKMVVDLTNILEVVIYYSICTYWPISYTTDFMFISQLI